MGKRAVANGLDRRGRLVILPGCGWDATPDARRADPQPGRRPDDGLNLSFMLT
jgi:hypothetical protein